MAVKKKKRLGRSIVPHSNLAQRKLSLELYGQRGEPNYLAATVVCYSRDGHWRGRFAGTKRRCRLEGCTGTRMRVIWADGTSTWPCSKGLKIRSDLHMQIG